MVSNNGKCLRCGATITELIGEAVLIEPAPGFEGPAYRAVTCLCRNCDAVLGVVVDPIRMAEEIENRLRKRLGV